MGDDSVDRLYDHVKHHLEGKNVDVSTVMVALQHAMLVVERMA